MYVKKTLFENYFNTIDINIKFTMIHMLQLLKHFLYCIKTLYLRNFQGKQFIKNVFPASIRLTENLLNNYKILIFTKKIY